MGEPVTSSTSARIAGRFRLIKTLGSGGFGTVYLAQDERRGNKPVAVKLLNEIHLSNPDEVDRFEREARLAESIHHPNVVQVIGHGQEDGRPFLVMECVEGQTLDAYLTARGPLSPERAAAIARQLLAGLAEIHRRRIYLLDLKPANILFDAVSWSAKIADFGAARAAGEPYLIDGELSVGTPPYMAPEQRAGQAIGPQTDLYALGIVLFELIRGDKPPTDDSGALLPDPALGRAMPGELRRIILRATAEAPADRFRSADEMSRAMARLSFPSGRRESASTSHSQPASQPLPPHSAQSQRRLPPRLRARLAQPSRKLAAANADLARALESVEEASAEFERIVLRIGGLLGLTLVTLLVLLLVVIVTRGLVR